MNAWIQCFAKCVLSITYLTHLLDVFALINCMLLFKVISTVENQLNDQKVQDK